MTSYNILISSVYVLYNIFKDKDLILGITKFQRKSTYEK